MNTIRMLGVAVATAAMLVPGTALAHGGPPVDVFTTSNKGSATVPFEGPCGGGPGVVTVEFQDTFHVTQFADGHSVVSGMQAGSFAFDPDDPAVASSSGRYRTGFANTLTQNSASSTSVFTAVGKDTNGDQIHFQVRSHFTFANGELRSESFTVSCA
jgi:hypothetical protein